MEDTGRSTVGDMLRSSLGEWCKTFGPEQARMGNTNEQFSIFGPIDTGSALVFLVHTGWTEAGPFDSYAVGVMVVAYDFSDIIALRMITAPTVLIGAPTQLEMIGTALRATFSEGEISYGVHIPVTTGDATLFEASQFVGEPNAVYDSGGSYCVSYSGEAALARFSSTGVKSSGRSYYNISSGDISGSGHPYYDGTSVFDGIQKGALPGVLKANATSLTTVSAVTFTAPGGLDTPLVLGGNASAIVGLINRSGHSPILFGFNPTDLALLWAKSTKKQESTVTVTVADTATTYRITISGQFVEVAGNAGGADATATDLKNACAASVQSQFVLRTFAVSGPTVTVQANSAGILYTFSASVSGGTGTITTSNNRYLLPGSITDPFAARAADGDELPIPFSFWGVLILNVTTGAVVACAVAESAVAQPSHDARIADDTLYVSSLSLYPDSFGGESVPPAEGPDADWQLFRFDTPPNNRTVLLEDVAMTATSLSISTDDIVGVISNMTLTSQPIQAQIDTFSIEETEYIY